MEKYWSLHVWGGVDKKNNPGLPDAPAVSTSTDLRCFPTDSDFDFGLGSDFERCAV